MSTHQSHGHETMRDPGHMRSLPCLPASGGASRISHVLVQKVGRVVLRFTVP